LLIIAPRIRHRALSKKKPRPPPVQTPRYVEIVSIRERRRL
jgi:hypothetical protein